MMIRERVYACCIILCLLSGFACAGEPRTKVPMQLIDGLPYVSLHINGKGPFLFGFDSGMGGDILLDSTVAADLGIQASGKIEAGDPTGKNNVLLNACTVADIAIGDIHFNNAEGILQDRRGMKGMEKVAGIIGIALFKDHVVTIDYPGNSFIIEKTRLVPNGKDILPYEPYGGGVPGIHIMVGDHPVVALIDTRSMSGGFKLPRSLIDQLHFATQPVAIGKGRTISNVIIINEVRLKEPITVGAYTFNEPTVTYPSLGETALIGAKLLREFRLSIDPASHAIQLTKGADIPAPAGAATAAPCEPFWNSYTGKYGDRSVTCDNNTLYIQRPGGRKLRMIPALGKEDSFTLEGVPGAEISFWRNDTDAITAINAKQLDGRWERADKDR